MRLLNSKTYKLREFTGNETDRTEYAILSHTWGRDEVTFQDMQAWNVRHKQKLGWKKIEHCCQQARKENLQWVWVDTICIDKSSSAELSEAINSMFSWYRNAEVCYAYLEDIPSNVDERPARWADIRWFSRGWTLQELLAPREMMFYGAEWCKLGTRRELCDLISKTSGIQVSALHGGLKELRTFSIAQRMCWASHRNTTRSEDLAYCLMGIFGVNMPLLYGEGGKRAFIRLQEEIMKDSDDHTLFAWDLPNDLWDPEDTALPSDLGLLADTPAFFRSAENILSFRRWDVSETFTMTNKGLKITVPMLSNPFSREYIAYLDCYHVTDNKRFLVGLALKELSPGGDPFSRVSGTTLDLPLSLELGAVVKRAIYIRKEIIHPKDYFQNSDHRLREFRLIQKPATHKLVGTYGCDPTKSTSDVLCGPPKTGSYWIDPQTWIDWHVVCRFEADISAHASRHSKASFSVVLGYDTDRGKPWCAAELLTTTGFTAPEESEFYMGDVWTRLKQPGEKCMIVTLPVPNHEVSEMITIAMRPTIEQDGSPVVEVEIYYYTMSPEINQRLGPSGLYRFPVFPAINVITYICGYLAQLLDTNMDEANPLYVREFGPEEYERLLKLIRKISVHIGAIQTLLRNAARAKQFFAQTENILNGCGELLEDFGRFLRLSSRQTVYNSIPEYTSADIYSVGFENYEYTLAILRFAATLYVLNPSYCTSKLTGVGISRGLRSEIWVSNLMSSSKIAAQPYRS